MKFTEAQIINLSIGKLTKIPFIIFLFISTFSFGQVVEIPIAGSGSIVVPANVKFAKIECMGGGGGGGFAITTNGAAGGGGGGGAYVYSEISVTAGQTLNYFVGSGGLGGTVSGIDATAGQDTWFKTSTTVMAKGGSGGLGATTNTSGNGGLGGSTSLSIASVKIRGGNGANGLNGLTSGTNGGGGGGSGGYPPNGIDAAGLIGGTVPAPMGDGGNGRYNNVGAAGIVYGGGAAGAHKDGVVDRAGGKGAIGGIRITWYCSPDISVVLNPLSNVCLGTTVSFTATPTNGGAAPVYTWKVNNVTAGTNSPTFNTSTLNNGDNVKCIIKSNSTTACYTGRTSTSNNITMNLPVPGTALSGNENHTCLVNGTDWVRFYSDGGNLLGEVNAQGNNLGDVEMKTLVTSPSYMQACGDPSNPLYHTAYMGRTWIMTSSIFTSGTNFPSAIKVRLPFTESELNELNIEAENITPGNPLDGGLSAPATAANMMLTKITGATENGIANSADCASTIRAISANSGSGVDIRSIANTEYLDFTIAQFSEFFLHKNINNSPLPVTLTDFSANCNNQVSLSWTTASEQNSDLFIIEKSRDGKSWNLVGEQAAAGSSNTVQNYNFTDENSWNATSYYRLRQLDFNGAEEVYGPISVSCENTESSMSVYPNPNNGSFTIEIESTEMYNNAQLFLTDLTGKVITSQTVNVANGTTQILINDLDLKMGTYLVTLRGADEQVKPVKVMVLE